MLRWFSLFLIAGLFHTTGHCETIDIFGAEDYPVICFLQDGKPGGLFPQILAGVSAYSGDTYTVQLLPWKRAQNYAEMGKGGIAHFSKTREREARYDFSKLVYGDRIRLVVLKGGEFAFKDLNDLKGKRIGAKFGASFGQKADAFFSTDAVEMQRDPGVINRLNKLLLRRIDVAVVEGADSDISKLLANDATLQKSKDKFVFLQEPLVDDALYLAFAKTMHRRATLERFNAGLVKFEKTEAYKKLLAR